MQNSVPFTAPVRSSTPIWLIVMLVVSAITFSIGLIVLAVKNAPSSSVASSVPSVERGDVTEHQVMIYPDRWSEPVPIPQFTDFWVKTTNIQFDVLEVKSKTRHWHLEWKDRLFINGEPMTQEGLGTISSGPDELTFRGRPKGDVQSGTIKVVVSSQKNH